MNREIRDKWTQALRSGNFKQGYFQLRGEDQEGNPVYCCLGVLCEVLGKKSRDVEFLDRDLAEEVGLDAPITPSVSNQKKLSVMNDDEGRNFLQIADWIENNL